jgi:cytochrome c oxidase cbb3-type subunit 3
MTIRATSLCAALLVLSLAACDREKRELHDSPTMVDRTSINRLSVLKPGPSTPDTLLQVSATTNAFDIAEGQKLFGWYNCSGCHSNGGGGMGPPLMDDTWIYGSEPENIYRTIIEGRPNGMPSFAGRIPDAQVWTLVAYVRTLGGLSPMQARSSRSDHMMMYPGSQIQHQPGQPKRSSLPPAAITP